MGEDMILLPITSITSQSQALRDPHFWAGLCDPGSPLEPFQTSPTGPWDPGSMLILPLQRPVFAGRSSEATASTTRPPLLLLLLPPLAVAATVAEVASDAAILAAAAVCGLENVEDARQAGVECALETAERSLQLSLGQQEQQKEAFSEQAMRSTLARALDSGDLAAVLGFDAACLLTEPDFFARAVQNDDASDEMGGTSLPGRSSAPSFKGLSTSDGATLDLHRLKHACPSSSSSTGAADGRISSSDSWFLRARDGRVSSATIGPETLSSGRSPLADRLLGAGTQGTMALLLPLPLSAHTPNNGAAALLLLRRRSAHVESPLGQPAPLAVAVAGFLARSCRLFSLRHAAMVASMASAACESLLLRARRKEAMRASLASWRRSCTMQKIRQGSDVVGALQALVALLADSVCTGHMPPLALLEARLDPLFPGCALSLSREEPAIRHGSEVGLCFSCRSVLFCFVLFYPSVFPVSMFVSRLPCLILHHRVVFASLPLSSSCFSSKHSFFLPTALDH